MEFGWWFRISEGWVLGFLCSGCMLCDSVFLGFAGWAFGVQRWFGIGLLDCLLVCVLYRRDISELDLRVGFYVSVVLGSWVGLWCWG